MRIVNRVQNSKNEIGILDKIGSQFSSISLHTYTATARLHSNKSSLLCWWDHVLTASFLLVFPTSLIFPFLFLYPDCLPCYVLLSLLQVFLLPWLTGLGYVLIPFFAFAVFFWVAVKPCLENLLFFFAWWRLSVHGIFFFDIFFFFWIEPRVCMDLGLLIL